MPQIAIPNQTTVPFTGVSSTSGAVPTAAASISQAPSPSSSAALARTLAAPPAAPPTNNGGSRSALSLFHTPAIMNLLQAPPPPVVTPPGSPPTTPPGTPPTPAPPGITTGSASLSWILGSESDLAGYKIYVGTSSGLYNYPGSPFTVGRTNGYTITNLPAGQTYFFALSAYDNAGNSSPLSSEVSKSIY